MAARIAVDKTRYFNDGRRKIDYVLPYDISCDKEPDEHKKLQKREEFQSNLMRRGLQLEITNFEKVAYVKIHAPWEFLTAQAEFMKLKMPIRENDVKRSRKSENFLDSLCRVFNLRRSREFKQEPSYFTAAFDRKMQEQFIIKSKDTFFKDSQRSRMVWDILARTSFDSTCLGHIGITKLIQMGVYVDAYPLHDGFITKEILDTNGRTINKPTDRQKLFTTWAKPSSFYIFQPLDLIRNYFGEKIAIYFAWLGFYTTALFPAAVFGLLCVIVGSISLQTDIPSLDICNQTGVGSTRMCPSCEIDCPVWNLSQSCLYSRITHVFDNSFTVVFAICMSIWATLFLEGWKRYQAGLTWDWHLMDFVDDDEPIRPEFETSVKTKARNPITDRWEPYLPLSIRLYRFCGSTVAVIFCLVLVVIFVFGVIVYRVIVEFLLKRESDEFLRSRAPLITSFTGAFLNLICIMLLDRIYQTLAYKLTAWENPRTESEFENSYTFKVFMFEFINFNSSLFYIAFFKGKFSVVPHDKSNYLFGYPQETCDPAGCMVELLIQLAVIMIGKQFLNNCMEILFPIISNKWRRFMSGDSTSAPRWVQDYKLNGVPEMHLFDEYLEMVLQYGFITLFVSAFPLAPLFALINNVMEIRLDAYKFIVAYRRPMPARAQNLGAWYNILDGISKLAVLCNACVIAFTSDFIPRLVYKFFYSMDGSMKGYVSDRMTLYDPGQWCSLNGNASDVCNINYCYFIDYRSPPCSLSYLKGDLGSFNYATCSCDPNNQYGLCMKWWHVFSAKLAFVILFEHVVFAIKGVVSYFIPDIPRKVYVQIQREAHLAKQAFYRHELLTKGKKIVKVAAKRQNGDAVNAQSFDSISVTVCSDESSEREHYEQNKLLQSNV